MEKGKTVKIKFIRINFVHDPESYNMAGAYTCTHRLNSSVRYRTLKYFYLYAYLFGIGFNVFIPLQLGRKVPSLFKTQKGNK